MQYTYKDGDMYVFMDMETFEETRLAEVRGCGRSLLMRSPILTPLMEGHNRHQRQHQHQALVPRVQQDSKISYTIVARAEGYTFTAEVCSVSVVQGSFICRL